MTFRIGITRDFLRPDGTLSFGDIGVSLFHENPEVEYEFLAENSRELRSDQVRDYDALLVLSPRVTAATLADAGRLAIIARFGVGYDTVDVEACTRNATILTIAPDGVRRPVAAAALTLILALSHKLLIKDRLTRAGRWAEKLDHMGMGLTGRTLGLVGAGNIGRELLALSRPLEMRQIVYDPYVSAESGAAMGVELVDLESLMREADFVCICCALTPETRHLIDEQKIALMKPTAYLVNMARGPIVDQKALTRALTDGRIQGAGLDVFETEPIDPADPILKLDRVIVSPHALCWTDECLRRTGQSACSSILDVASGRIPPNVVNRDVLHHPHFEEKLRQLGARR
jgi:phosphoglycerate dehydrogenase-like enzyme